MSRGEPKGRSRRFAPGSECYRLISPAIHSARTAGTGNRIEVDLTRMGCDEKKRKPHLSCLLLMVVLTSTVSGQTGTPTPPNEVEMRVRIMDSRSHRSLKGRKVQVDWWDANGNWHPLIGRTAADGVVIFRIKQPIPPRIAVQDFWAYNCAHPREFATQEVLGHGVVAAWPRSGSKKLDDWCTADLNDSQPQRRPGEIAFFVHPLNRFQYAWYSLWE